jgi:hypothetical protein
MNAPGSGLISADAIREAARQGSPRFELLPIGARHPAWRRLTETDLWPAAAGDEPDAKSAGGSRARSRWSSRRAYLT